MKSKQIELLSISIGILLSLSGLVFGTYEPLWNLLHVEESLRNSLTIALSILILLIGFLIAIFSKFANVEDNFWKMSHQLRFEIPQLSAFKVFDADYALTYLTGQLSVLKTMLNTRIVSNGNAGYLTQAGEKYNKAIEDAISKGLYFKEIVNEAWETEAIARKEYLTSIKKANNYEYVIFKTLAPSFINFCVLEYKNSRKEVLFGWAITKGRKFEQKCFVSDETSVVHFFETWFIDLFEG